MLIKIMKWFYNCTVTTVISILKKIIIIVAFPKSIKLVPLGMKVVNGPFKGMGIGFVAWGSAHAAKVIGTYEKELWPIIDEIKAIKFKHFIDIGAAEGYYAIGLPRLLGGFERVVAFETSLEARKMLLNNVKKNNLESVVVIKGKCECNNISEELTNGKLSLIICDIEGGENELIDPEKIHELKNTYILVETHDFIINNVTKMIAARFLETHHIQKIDLLKRVIADFPASNFISTCLHDWLKLRMMGEGRNENMRWLWMKPLPPAKGGTLFGPAPVEGKMPRVG